MTALLLTIALAATPVKLAAPGLTGSGMPPDRAAFLSEYLATQVSLRGVKVITQKEIVSMLGMERQKQLLGCTDSSSCVAEIAAALGTDAVMIGDVALFGSRYVATLKVLRADNAQAISIQSIEAANENDFLEAMRGAAGRLSDDTLRAFGGEPVNLSTNSSSPSRLWAVLPLGLGVVAGGLSPVFFNQSQHNFSLLTDGMVHSYVDSTGARDNGRLLQTLGWVAVATAGVMIAVAAFWWFAVGAPP